MHRLKTFALKRPFLFGLSMIFIYSMITAISYPVHYLFPENEAGIFYGDAFSKAIAFVLFLFVLWGFGWLRPSGLRKINLGWSWAMILIVLIYKVLTTIHAFTGSVILVIPNTPASVAESVYLFPAALVEEVMYRGVVLLAMIAAWGDTKKGIVKAVLLSSILFGMLHLLNAIANPFGMVLFQAVIVSLPGILYAALFLRTGSLWPAIIIHWLTNASLNAKIATMESFSETPQMWIQWGVYLLPLVVFSFYLIWKLPVDFRIEGLVTDMEPAVIG